MTKADAKRVKRLTTIADYLSARYSFMERTSLVSLYIDQKVNRELSDILAYYDSLPNYDDYNTIMKAYADGTAKAEQIIEKIFAYEIYSLKF